MHYAKEFIMLDPRDNENHIENRTHATNRRSLVTAAAAVDDGFMTEPLLDGIGAEAHATEGENTLSATAASGKKGDKDPDLREQPAPGSADAKTWSAVGSMAMCVTLLIAAEFMPVSLLTPIASDLGSTPGVAGQAIAVSGFFAVVTSLLIATVAPSSTGVSSCSA